MSQLIKSFSELNSAVTSTDSYKVSHWLQMPKDTDGALFYIESRGGKFDEVVSAGCNYVAHLLEKPVTKQHVEIARRLYLKHFGKDIFNYEGWMSIAERGYMPVEFRAIPEGTPVPVKISTATLFSEKSDTWLAGWLETMTLRGLWYPSSVSTLSRECKKVLNKYLLQTSDLTGADFDIVLNTRLHDFGARGSTSPESAGIGGLAHMYNFLGSDTVEGMIMAMTLYNDFDGFLTGEDEDTVAPGVSIPAREHSTTVCYGKENEQEAYLNSIREFGDGIYACVLDSWSFTKAVSRLEELKPLILEKGGCFVVRPDSGNMMDNIMFALEELGRIFGYTYNSKGYKVLNAAVRIIQGDEIHGPETLERVLNWMESKRWSSENIAFGMGGGLLQEVTRDTQKFADKLCAIRIKGEWKGVFKNPEGAEWKKSKAGLLMTITDGKSYRTIDTLSEPIPNGWRDAMKTYYSYGFVDRADTMEIIRNRIAI